MSISLWTVCNPCCQDLDDLFNICVYDSVTGEVLYYIDCDMEPISFDLRNDFVVGGSRTYYNYNIADGPNKYRIRVAENIDGAFICNNLFSFDPKLPIGSLLSKLNNEAIPSRPFYTTPQPTKLMTDYCRVFGDKVIRPTGLNFRSFDSKYITPKTTVTVNNKYTGIGYRDCVTVSGDYVMFSKTGEDTKYTNRNSVIVDTQRTEPYGIKGFTAAPAVNNPVLHIKFSGIKNNGVSVIIDSFINVQINETASSLLTKLNNLSTALIFTTQQTTAIENGKMSYDYTFEGKGILNVSIEDVYSKVYRGGKTKTTTCLFFNLTPEDEQRIKNGEKLFIYLNSNRKRIQLTFYDNYLMVVDGFDYFVGLVKDRDIYYIMVRMDIVYKTQIILGNKQPDFSDDVLFQRLGIYDSSDCIYQLFNRNNSDGLYRIIYSKPFSYDSGYVRSSDDIDDEEIFMSNYVSSDNYKYICLISYFLSFEVLMAFPEITDQYKPFGKVSNGILNLKGTHHEDESFKDILHHSSGRVYALGFSRRYMVQFPGAIHGSTMFYDSAEMSTNLFNNNMVPTNLFELDKDTLEIKKAVSVNNWVIDINPNVGGAGFFVGYIAYMYKLGGLREVDGQLWVGNIEYSTNLDFVKQHKKIIYNYGDFIYNGDGELVILINNVVAAVDFDGNCRWAFDLRTKIKDSSLYAKYSEIKVNNENNSYTGTYPEIYGARKKLLTNDSDYNIYVTANILIDQANNNGGFYSLFKFDKDGNLLFSARDPYVTTNGQYISIKYKDNKVYSMTNRQQRKRRLNNIRLVIGDHLQLEDQI